MIQYEWIINEVIQFTLAQFVSDVPVMSPAISSVSKTWSKLAIVKAQHFNSFDSIF